MKYLIGCGLLCAFSMGAHAKSLLSDSIETTAYIEVEASSISSYTKERVSDIALSNAFFGVSGDLSAAASGFLSFLYRDYLGDDIDGELGVDEAYLSFVPARSIILRAGKEYVPFGVGFSHVVSDPLSLWLSEARETVLQSSFSRSGWLLTTYVFSGGAQYNDSVDGKDADLGAKIQWDSGRGGKKGWLFGVDYISNIADTDRFEEFFSSNGILLDGNYQGGVGYFGYRHPKWGVSTEYVGTVDQFLVSEVGFANEGASPAAFGVELWTSISGVMRGGSVAITYQSTAEAVDLGLPETRLSVALMQDNLARHWGWGVEVFSDADYSIEDGGTNEKATGIVFQVSGGF